MMTMANRVRNASWTMMIVVLVGFIIYNVLWFVGDFIPTDTTIDLDVLSLISEIIFIVSAYVAETIMIINGEFKEEA